MLARISAPPEPEVATKVISKGVEVNPFLSNWNLNRASLRISTGVDP